MAHMGNRSGVLILVALWIRPLLLVDELQRTIVGHEDVLQQAKIRRKPKARGWQFELKPLCCRWLFLASRCGKQFVDSVLWAGYKHRTFFPKWDGVKELRFGGEA